MSAALITGSAGLIGSAACKKWHDEGFRVVGIDNDMRAEFFGADASTKNTRAGLEASLSNYRHYSVDIRDAEAMDRVFREAGADIEVIIHTAAQPSHDWAARAPLVDFGVNALGTLNVLDASSDITAPTPNSA